MSVGSKAIGDPRQLPMFIPDSSWIPPEPIDLPDFRLDEKALIGIDTETVDPNLSETGPGFFKGESHVAGVSMSIGDRAVYMPLRHPEDNGPHGDSYRRYIRDLMKSPNSKVGANLLYDVESLFHLSMQWSNEGEDLCGTWLDVQTAQPLLNEMQSGGYNLDNLAKIHVNDKKDKTLLKEALATYGLKAGGIGLLPARFVGEYAEHDARLPIHIFRKQYTLMEKEDLLRVFDVETRLHKVVWAMKKKGVRVDLDKLYALDDQAKAKLVGIHSKIRELTGFTLKGTLDWWSNKELEKLCRKLGVHDLERTAAGRPSFTNDWLAASPHEVLRLAAAGRKVDKMKRDFIDTYKKQNISGILRSQFMALKRDEGGAVTGRFSSQNINLQQVPARDEFWGPAIRSLFTPWEGQKWLKADYGCYDDTTEILTRRGWILFKDLTEDDEVCQVDTNGNGSFVKPISRQVYDVTDTMTRVTGRSHDMLLTNNHRCYTYAGNGKHHVVRADELHKRQDNDAILNAVTSPGDVVLSEHRDEILLAVAIQADSKNVGPGQCQFSLKREDKIRLLSFMLGNLGCTYTVTEPPSRPGFKLFTVDEETIPDAVWDMVSNDKEKNFNRDIVRASPDCAKIFINELRYWDGSVRDYGGAYYSNNKNNIDIVSEMLFLNGYRASATETAVKWSSRTDRTRLSGSTIEKVPYVGKVYCVTVPTGQIAVRRNGKPFVSGNSQEPRVAVHFAASTVDPKTGEILVGAEEMAQKFRDEPLTDLHQVCADIMGISRKQAKEINLGILYAMGVAKLAYQLGIPESEAKVLLAMHVSNLPFLRRLQQLTTDAANARGYVRTYLGRRRRFNEWETNNWGGKSRKFSHKALNSIVQGTSADMTKMAMLMGYEDHGFIPLLTVHDELGYSVDSDEMSMKCVHFMENALNMKVPILVEPEVGPSWGETELMAA